jgi:hypothetical protein
MAHTLNLTTKVERNGVALQGLAALTAGSLVEIDESFNDGDMAIIQKIDVSALKLIYILSDVSIAVNFDASGDPNFFSVNLTAGEPWVWYPNSGYANPFSADVTAMNFSSSPVPVRVQAVILTDPTP